MTLGAPCWASRFIGLLCLVMAAFTIFMIGVFCRKGLSFCLGFMALFAKLPRGLTLLPCVVALHAIDLKRLGMFLVSERHLPVGRIILHNVLCKETADHEDREHETCNDPNAD